MYVLEVTNTKFAGEVVGVVVGVPVVGTTVGERVGPTVEGSVVGFVVGVVVCAWVGLSVGADVVGTSDGAPVGTLVGGSVGTAVGLLVGVWLGGEIIGSLVEFWEAVEPKVSVSGFPPLSCCALAIPVTIRSSWVVAASLIVTVSFAARLFRFYEPNHSRGQRSYDRWLRATT